MSDEDKNFRGSLVLDLENDDVTCNPRIEKLRKNVCPSLTISMGVSSLGNWALCWGLLTQSRLKAAVRVTHGSNYPPTFVLYQIFFNLRALMFDSKHERRSQ